MFSLLTLFTSPRFLIVSAIVAFLAFTHVVAYRKGSAHVQQEWSLDKARANSEARALENRRQDRANEATQLAAARSTRITADAASARNELSGVRDERDAIRFHAAQSLAAATLTVAAYENVFGQCVRAYSELAEVADRHASDALTLHSAWPQ